MSLHDRLSALASALPPDASVTLSSATLREWLQEDGEKARGATSCDLTVPQVAERLGRKPATVREWIRRGQLEGYQFQGREYRVTEHAIEMFMERQREGSYHGRSVGRAVRGTREVADLGAWRKVKRAGGEA